MITIPPADSRSPTRRATPLNKQWAWVPSLELVGSRVITKRTTRATVCCVELTTR